MPPIYKQPPPQFEMRSPTALDRLVTSKNAFFAFAGIIVGVSVWAIWRNEPVLDSPRMDDPFGDPSEWTEPELRRWLNARNIQPGELETREELVQRVRACISMRTATEHQRSYGGM